MKTLIPSSGGLNSAYTVWWFLENTADDIILLFIDEEHMSDASREAERTRFDANMEWLSVNVRPLHSQIYKQAAKVEPEMLPVRTGFLHLSGRGQLKERMRVIVDVSKDIIPDKIVYGLSLENSWSGRWTVNEILAGGVGDIYYSGWSLETPYDRDTLSMYPTNYDEWTGRYEQLALMPENVQNAMSVCECGTCLSCLYRLAGKSESAKHMSPREFDRYLSLLGQYGDYRHLANPLTYEYRNHAPEYLRKIIDGSLKHINTV